MVRLTNNEDSWMSQALKLEAENEELRWMSQALKLEAENKELRTALSLLGYVIIAAGGEVIISKQTIRDHPYPLMTREDRPVTDDIRLTAILAPVASTQDDLV